MTDQITVPKQTWDAMREALEKSLQSMVQVVQFRETGRGRPPEQTCIDAIAEASVALTAANAVSEPQWYPVEKMSEQIAELSLVIATNSFYQQGHKDGLEWAAQMVEYNDPRTGDWMWDDRNVLANVIRKGPELPDAVSEQPQAQGEPLTDEQIYKTIIQWDEGGGKRSRRELARRLSKLTNQPQAQGEQRYLSIERVSGFPKKLETGPQPVLYSDSINGCMVRRDDVWLALTSHLNPQATEPAWRPIESAPKDGTMVLCWVSAVQYGETDEGQQFQRDISQIDFGSWEDGLDGNGYFDPYCGQIGDQQHVTHWMPLPAAPEAKQ